MPGFLIERFGPLDLWVYAVKGSRGDRERRRRGKEGLWGPGGRGTLTHISFYLGLCHHSPEVNRGGIPVRGARPYSPMLKESVTDKGKLSCHYSGRSCLVQRGEGGVVMPGGLG